MTQTIIYDKYIFELKEINNQLNLKLINTQNLYSYTSIIKESEISIRPINKLFIMILRALNKKPNYIIEINEDSETIICYIYYNNDIIDFTERIIFTKNNNQSSLIETTTNLIEEINKLKSQMIVFGYRNFGEKMVFEVNIEIIDLRPFDNFIRYSNIEEFNKLTNAKKIIMNTLSPIFTFEYDIVLPCGHAYYGASGQIRTIKPFPIKYNQGNDKHIINCHCGYKHNSQNYINHFNHPSIYLPSITCVEIFINHTSYNFVNDFTKFGSLPNLEELYITCYDNIVKDQFCLSIDFYNLITTSPNKKLKHIVFKKNNNDINFKNLDIAKGYSEINNILLEVNN